MADIPEKEAQLLQLGCSRLGLSLHKDSLVQLLQYYTELVHWSRRMNLVGKKQRSEQIIENHFLDSLMLQKYIEPNVPLYDIGSGAGFPGLVCKVVIPELPLTLVEPRLKRVSFLRHVVRALEMKRVEIVAERAEGVRTVDSGKYTITGRAVAEIADFMTMISHLLTPGSKIVIMKGPRWRDELSAAEELLQKMDIQLQKVDEFALPFSGAARAVLSFQDVRQ